MAGAGLDANIVRRSQLRTKGSHRQSWPTGPPASRSFRIAWSSSKFVSKGKVYRCGFALASRVRNYGGDLEIASGASCFAMIFEVVLFESANPLRYAWYMFGVGLRRVQSMQGVRNAFRAMRRDLLRHRSANGRRVRRTSNRAARNVPRALTLLIPPTVYG